MAAFDPATIQLLRDGLAKTQADLDRDYRLLAKLPEDSRSKMATRLRERIAEGERVICDAKWLLEFAQRLDGQADRHAVERAAAESEPGR